MITAKLVPISFTFNFVTDKSRLRHGSVQVHHFPFSNLNFINHVVRSLGCFGKCKLRKLKTLEAKDGYKVNHGIDLEQFDNVEYAKMLQDCVRRKSVGEGKQIHAQIIRNQEDADVFLGNGLVIMYAKCGNLVDARQVFDKMPERNIVSWNAMLSAYIQSRYWEDALKLVGLMHDADIKLDEFTCSILIGICAGMRDPIEGKALHGMAIKAGFVRDEYVEITLVNMYAKCILLIDARRVFDKMPERSIVSWNAMLSAYIQNGYWEDALKLVCSMHDADIKQNKFICSSLLGVCAGVRDPIQGKALHGMAIKAGFVYDEYVQSALVDMYAKCNLLMDARRVFEKVSKPNIVSWNTMMVGYIRNGRCEQALYLFQQMQIEGIRPDEFTFSSVLGICVSLAAFNLGKQVHVCIIKEGYESDSFVRNAIDIIYMKLRHNSYNMFEKTPEQNILVNAPHQ